ncbi:hypothetical protein tinsulaeT_27900 [Thalassotalea insulae]|uniref:Uncharacterized protein n=1 Tax=Thalassotalea insulae TaxID=2056778 RepID=A0ABQ6GY57_9GAMM|nr:hypothetical protein [Thalassotalea insulae]GLX79450.1 hypothetical protein tinsulaeT_27900 [Thalassotalea insulae]
MINNINPYSSFFNTNTATTNSSSELEQIIGSHKQSKPDNNSQLEASNSNLYLSSKAQKISALSNEFFSGGNLAFNDLDSLKQRIYQLGLISKQEYAQLTDTELSDDELAASNNLSSQGVANYIGDFLQRLDETDAGKINDTDNTTQESETLTALKEALNAAKNIISNLDQAKTDADFKATLANSMSFIKDTINATSFEKMPLDDKVGLTKVYQTLELVDKISPQRLTNDKLNRYIELSV